MHVGGAAEISYTDIQLGKTAASILTDVGSTPTMQA